MDPDELSFFNFLSHSPYSICAIYVDFKLSHLKLSPT